MGLPTRIAWITQQLLLSCSEVCRGSYGSSETEIYQDEIEGPDGNENSLSANVASLSYSRKRPLGYRTPPTPPHDHALSLPLYLPLWDAYYRLTMAPSQSCSWFQPRPP